MTKAQKKTFRNLVRKYVLKNKTSYDIFDYKYRNFINYL